MDIKDLQKVALKNAQQKGFWPETITPEVLEARFGDQMMLIVGEVHEGYECWRDHEPLLHYGKDSNGAYRDFPEKGAEKPEGLASELADVVIRTAQLAEAIGIDLSEVIRIKHEYNKTRPFKHGNKKT